MVRPLSNSGSSHDGMSSTPASSAAPTRSKRTSTTFDDIMDVPNIHDDNFSSHQNPRNTNNSGSLARAYNEFEGIVRSNSGSSNGSSKNSNNSNNGNAGNSRRNGSSNGNNFHGKLAEFQIPLKDSDAMSVVSAADTVDVPHIREDVMRSIDNNHKQRANAIQKREDSLSKQLRASHNSVASNWSAGDDSLEFKNLKRSGNFNQFSASLNQNHNQSQNHNSNSNSNSNSSNSNSNSSDDDTVHSTQSKSSESIFGWGTSRKALNQALNSNNAHFSTYDSSSTRAILKSAYSFHSQNTMVTNNMVNKNGRGNSGEASSPFPQNVSSPSVSMQHNQGFGNVNNNQTSNRIKRTSLDMTSNKLWRGSSTGSEPCLPAPSNPNSAQNNSTAIGRKTRKNGNGRNNNYFNNSDDDLSYDVRSNVPKEYGEYDEGHHSGSKNGPGGRVNSDQYNNRTNGNITNSNNFNSYRDHGNSQRGSSGSDTFQQNIGNSSFQNNRYGDDGSDNPNDRHKRHYQLCNPHRQTIRICMCVTVTIGAIIGIIAIFIPYWATGGARDEMSVAIQGFDEKWNGNGNQNGIMEDSRSVNSGGENHGVNTSLNVEAASSEDIEAGLEADSAVVSNSTANITNGAGNDNDVYVPIFLFKPPLPSLRVQCSQTSLSTDQGYAKCVSACLPSRCCLLNKGQEYEIWSSSSTSLSEAGGANKGNENEGLDDVGTVISSCFHEYADLCMRYEQECSVLGKEALLPPPPADEEGVIDGVDELKEGESEEKEVANESENIGGTNQTVTTNDTNTTTITNVTTVNSNETQSIDNDADSDNNNNTLPMNNSNSSNETNISTEAEMMQLAERIVHACSKSKLESKLEKDREECLDLCFDKDCCFVGIEFEEVGGNQDEDRRRRHRHLRNHRLDQEEYSYDDDNTMDSSYYEEDEVETDHFTEWFGNEPYLNSTSSHQNVHATSLANVVEIDIIHDVTKSAATPLNNIEYCGDDPQQWCLAYAGCERLFAMGLRRGLH